MKQDYESWVWLRVLGNLYSDFPDNLTMWVVVSPGLLLLFYSAACVCLIPLSVAHRTFADARRDEISIRRALIAALYCYPVLLPWAWNCKSERDLLRTIYYAVVNVISFLAVGMGLFRFQSYGGDSTYYEHDNSYLLPKLGETDIFAIGIMANLTFAYSIALLVWKHRLHGKFTRNKRVEETVKIFFHPSVMLSLWFGILMLVFLGTQFTRFIDEDNLNFYFTVVVGMIYIACTGNMVWIVVSCYLMVQKEVRYRREINGGAP